MAAVTTDDKSDIHRQSDHIQAGYKSPHFEMAQISRDRGHLYARSNLLTHAVRHHFRPLPTCLSPLRRCCPPAEDQTENYFQNLYFLEQVASQHLEFGQRVWAGERRKAGLTKE
jgi:hypothetical protein